MGKEANPNKHNTIDDSYSSLQLQLFCDWLVVDWLEELRSTEGKIHQVLQKYQELRMSYVLQIDQDVNFIF